MTSSARCRCSTRRSRSTTCSAESLVDAQIGYSFQSGALKGLSFSLSGTNLTDEPFLLNNTAIDPVQPRSSIRSYGATYALAVSYIFE